MIVYNDIMKKLAEHGWSSYRIRKEKAIPEGTITRIRNNDSISMDTLNVICELCECQPGDLLIWIPDIDIKKE